MKNFSQTTTGHVLAFCIVQILASHLLSCTYQKAQLSQEVKTDLEKFNGHHQNLQDFFKDSNYSRLKISPNGRFIAALYPQNGVNSLAILSSDLSQFIFTGKFDEDRHITYYEWVNDTRLILMAGKKFGYLDGRREDSQIYFVDYDGKNFKNFFAKDWANYELIRTLPNEPEYVVMAKYHWADRGRPVAIKVNVNNGVVKVLATPPIRSGTFLADEAGEVNVAVEWSDKSFSESQIHYRLGRGMPWKKLEYPVSKKGFLSPISLDSKTKALFLQSNLETGRIGIYRLDLSSGKSELVSGDSKVDVGDLIMDKDRLVGAFYDPDYTEVDVIDPESEVMKLYRDLLVAFKHQRVSGLNMTRDQSMATFMVSSDKNSGEFYKISVKDRKVQKLGSARPWMKPEAMSEMKPIVFKARDGQEIHGYLTVPSTGPQRNLPAILIVHGGPHGVRDYWGYHAEAQFFADRGFAVLQVNYRGSGGYGSSFLEVGYQQWGLIMQDDLTDATKWLVRGGYADSKRLAIYGGSYGGYAALMGVVREPDLYRCAATNAGATDLTIQRNDSDTAESEAGEEYLDKALGKVEADLKARSPVYQVDKIKVPIFIAAGKDDVRVPFSNAERLRLALDKAGKPYEWLAKDSEGHGFQQAANRYEFYMRLAKFLEKHTALPADSSVSLPAQRQP